MANNRVELATLPRHIETIKGKTSASGLLLDTELVSWIFEPATSPAMTGRQNANLLITDTGTYDRPESNTLAIIFEDDGNDADSFMDGAWYSYQHGTTRAEDEWTLLSSTVVTASSAEAADENGTIVRTYSFLVDAVPLIDIPIATWAQDATTLIPREKLPDTAYGETYFYTSETLRNANSVGFSDRAHTVPIPGPVGGPRVVWHQNDVAIVGAASDTSQTAYLYVGADQGTTAAVTTNDDWLQLGATVAISKLNQFMTVVNRGNVTAVNDANSVIYDVSADGTMITLTGTGVMIGAVTEVSVNGVSLVEGTTALTGDYLVDAATRKILTFNQFVLASAGTDLVHIAGVTI